MDVVSSKVATSVGAGKAKRAAAANQVRCSVSFSKISVTLLLTPTTSIAELQKRGLNATGKATAQQIKAAVSKEGKKKVGRGAAKAAVNKRAGAAKRGAGAGGAGLKISFRPAELGKTTEKNTALQIKAVLAKTSGGRGGGGGGARGGRGGGRGGRR
jgi:hypothetical protein